MMHMDEAVFCGLVGRGWGPARVEEGQHGGTRRTEMDTNDTRGCGRGKLPHVLLATENGDTRIKCFCAVQMGSS